MRPSAVIILLVLAFGGARSAMAADRGPVCREPSVVDEIAREVKERNYYSRVDTRLVTEQPTIDPRIVRCQVCVQSGPYDTLRFGDRPMQQCIPRDFEVRIVSRGFVVGALR